MEEKALSVIDNLNGRVKVTASIMLIRTGSVKPLIQKMPNQFLPPPELLRIQKVRIIHRRFLND